MKMPAYIQGNLALKQKQKPVQKVKIRETTKVVYKNKPLQVQEKMLYLFTVVLCVLVAGVIIWRYSQIYQMNAHMLKMQQEIRQIQAENSALKQEVEKLQSTDRLMEEAKKMGFKPYDDKQVNQVAPNKTASASNSANNTKKVAYNP
jgi:cell division protein FtsL